jgi:gluconate 5-dehydrogenase
LGRQIALGLGEAGAEIVVCGRRGGPLEETRVALETMRRACRVVQADLTTDEGIEQALRAADGVDILVNCAGVSPLQPWTSLSLEDWRAVHAVNVEAAFRLMQGLSPAMVDRKWGRIINVVSIYGIVAGDPGRYPGIAWDVPAYTASKHGLLGITRYIAVRLAPYGVTVNALSPGMFPTEMSRAKLTRDVEAELVRGTPVGRLGDATDLAAAAVFLASPGAAFVVGHNLVVDGGWTVW